MNIEQIANDISIFLNKDLNDVKSRLLKGFHENHRLVAEDFTKNNTDVNNSESLLSWYRKTDSYIWELSSYHLDGGFNYAGMCQGISDGLTATGRNKVLVLGDGIGTLSMCLSNNGIDVTYHDLENSQTSNFAQHRFKSAGLDIKTHFTDSWNPSLGQVKYDAIVALDFFEHLVNVDDWVKAVYAALSGNGAFIAQNAFAIGDAEHGNSIPMHLSINNKYEKEWPELLLNTGFVLHENKTWWIKP